MIVISNKDYYKNNGYTVLNDDVVIAVGVDWDTAIVLVSKLASIVWTTKLDADRFTIQPCLIKGKLYVDNNLATRVSKFDEETGLINDGYSTTSYVKIEGYDYFFNYEDALAAYKQQIENKLGELYTELNYWNKVKLSLN